MTRETKIYVKGMSCSGCEKRIEKALKEMRGISEVKADHNRGEVIIKSDREIDKRELKRTLEDLDFELIEK